MSCPANRPSIFSLPLSLPPTNLESEHGYTSICPDPQTFPSRCFHYYLLTTSRFTGTIHRSLRTHAEGIHDENRVHTKSAGSHQRRASQSSEDIVGSTGRRCPGCSHQRDVRWHSAADGRTTRPSGSQNRQSGAQRAAPRLPSIPRLSQSPQNQCVRLGTHSYERPQ